MGRGPGNQANSPVNIKDGTTGATAAPGKGPVGLVVGPQVVPDRGGDRGRPPVAAGVPLEESIEGLKKRAHRAIPIASAEIQRWKANSGGPEAWAGMLKFGATARNRFGVYESSWSHLRPDRGRFWFQAATMVTGRGGISYLEGTAEKIGGVILSPLTSGDIDFVLQGNEFLFPYNVHNWYILRGHGWISGFETLSGRELDRGLVVLEQTLVQRFMESYSWRGIEDRRSSMKRISEGFYGSFANEWVKRTLVALFGGSFDFGSIDHRIPLGVALVDLLRRQNY